MAAGDKYFTCDNNFISTEMVIRDLVVVGDDGEPALKIYPTSGGGGGGSFPSPTSRTPSFTRVTNASNVAAGARSVSIYNSGAADGSVLTTTLKPSESVNFTAGMYDTLDAIAYVATGTEFIISKVV